MLNSGYPLECLLKKSVDFELGPINELSKPPKSPTKPPKTGFCRSPKADSKGRRKWGSKRILSNIMQRSRRTGAHTVYGCVRIPDVNNKHFLPRGVIPSPTLTLATAVFVQIIGCVPLARNSRIVSGTRFVQVSLEGNCSCAVSHLLLCI